MRTVPASPAAAWGLVAHGLPAFDTVPEGGGQRDRRRKRRLKRKTADDRNVVGGLFLAARLGVDLDAFQPVSGLRRAQ